MVAKFDERRRQVFFNTLAACGNQTLAAERAKVSRSWVQLHRSTDPAFDAAVREALAAARERLGAAAAAGRGAVPEGWAFFDGIETTVRGVGGTGARDRARRVQVGRARVRQWTAATEARFLTVLGATCNVRAACAAVGLHHGSAYAHRKRWPGFAAAWEQALETGLERLERALLAGWVSGVEPVGDAPLPEMEMMSAEQAIELLKIRRGLERHREKTARLNGAVGWRR